MSFEFNQFYLEFLAYHHLSNRFRSFMLDSECKRVEAGWMLEETKLLARSDSSLNDVTADGGSVAATFSVWDYIDEQHRASPVFFNFHYSTSHDSGTIKVCFVICVSNYLKLHLDSNFSFKYLLQKKTKLALSCSQYVELQFMIRSLTTTFPWCVVVKRIHAHNNIIKSGQL